MDSPLNVKIIVGSTRPGRFSEHAAKWIHDIAAAKGFNLETLDLREHVLPLVDQAAPPSTIQDGNYGDEAANAWAKKIAEADAYIIVTPEYNHATSAVLKNAFDRVYKEWNNKVVGMVAYGSLGGGRAVENVRLIAAELQMASVRQGVYIMAPWMFMENGAPKAGAMDSYVHAAETMLSQLEMWGRALREARNSH